MVLHVYSILRTQNLLLFSLLLQSTYGSSGDDATNMYRPPNSLTGGALLFTGKGTTAKVAGGGIGGPLGPRPSPSNTCKKQEKLSQEYCVSDESDYPPFHLFSLSQYLFHWGQSVCLQHFVVGWNCLVWAVYHNIGDSNAIVFFLLGGLCIKHHLPVCSISIALLGRLLCSLQH